jgi:hypothetical protein
MSAEFEQLSDGQTAKSTLPSDAGGHWSSAAQFAYSKPGDTTSGAVVASNEQNSGVVSNEQKLVRSGPGESHSAGSNASISEGLNETGRAGTVADVKKQLTVDDGKKSFIEEHPVAVGLGVTTLAGAALLLSRGRIANALVPRSQNVLVVEAAPFIGKAMKHSLQEAGHSVTWVTEIGSLRPLVGMTDDGAQVALKMSRFHTAFIDPNHVTKAAVDFDKLAPFFRSGNVRTIGTSVMSKTNETMLAKGVDIAADKTTVLMSLVGKRLDLQQVVRSPGSAQKMLTDMKSSVDTEEMLALRKRTEQLVTEFLKGR